MRRVFDHTRLSRDDTTEASPYEASAPSSFSSGGGDDRRVMYLLLVFMLLLLLAAGRLVWWQVVQSEDLTHMAESRRSNVIKLKARRGTIYDRNGNVLATSEDCITIVCNPKEVEEPYRTAEVLASHLGGSSYDYVGSLQVNGVFSYIAKRVDTDVANAIKAELTELQLPGVYYRQDTRRVYPYGAVGGQVLGVVGQDDANDDILVGKSGLELYYNDILSGQDGEMIVEMGLYGTPIAGAASQVTKKCVDGTDIVISLDINVQRVAEQRIVEGVDEYRAESGSVMVTDPQNGEILAACSTPLLNVADLSVVEAGADSLKLVSDSYEPGSIFKVLTASIGIEEGLIDPAQEYYVPAYVQVGDDMVADDDGREYDMYMDLREILRRSSNTGAALLAQDYIGADTFAAGVERFGIGQLTGIDFPGEVRGIVKARDEYDGSSLGSMSFGQGLAIPLVQMVRAIGAVGNHGIPTTPHFLLAKGTETVVWNPGERIIDNGTSRKVIDMMRTVIQEGTGVHAQVPGYDIAGKTGTGERADAVKGGYLEDAFTSSLIGFAPASDPTVLVYVGLNGTPFLAYDSAAPLFSSIMGEAIVDMGVLPDA